MSTENQLLPDLDPDIQAEIDHLRAENAALLNELEGWRNKRPIPRGKLAYERRSRGHRWEDIADALGISQPLLLAKRWAYRSGSPWPVPKVA